MQLPRGRFLRPEGDIKKELREGNKTFRAESGVSMEYSTAECTLHRWMRFKTNHIKAFKKRVGSWHSDRGLVTIVKTSDPELSAFFLAPIYIRFR